jgi:hypothetical protein
MFGIRLGKVVKVNYGTNTVDVLMDVGMGVLKSVPVAFPLGSTKAGCVELPVLKTIKDLKGDVVDPTSGTTFQQEHLFYDENSMTGKVDLEDGDTNYAYALVVAIDEATGHNRYACIGFLVPHRNQLIFDPDNVDPKLPAVVQTAIKKLKGGLLHRTNSGVYWTVDLDGNMEWAHPNGSFLRIGEFPTREEDGVIHVDLRQGNKRARDKDDNPTPNRGWDETTQKGSDGKRNSVRKSQAHVEIVTEKGIVEIDINKKTGNVLIKTPQNATEATDKTINQVTIICGGNATLESVAGDIKVQAIKGKIDVQANTTINEITDSAKNGSILLGQNGENGIQHLVFLEKLVQKFNNHKHNCPKHGPTSTPDKKLDSKDGTFVTKAG